MNAEIKTRFPGIWLGEEYADPACWAKAQTDEKTVHEILREEGYPYLKLMQGHGLLSHC